MTRRYGRFNQTGAVCGAPIPYSDFLFSQFQLGEISETELRDELGVSRRGRAFQDHYWNECIRLENEHHEQD